MPCVSVVRDRVNCNRGGARNRVAPNQGQRHNQSRCQPGGLADRLRAPASDFRHIASSEALTRYQSNESRNLTHSEDIAIFSENKGTTTLGKRCACKMM